MSTRNAYIRYRVINSYLKDHGFATKEQLKEACERALDIYPLGERTIEGDIYDMRYNNQLGFNAPIVYDRRIKAYRYEDEDYSIDALPMNNDDLQALKFAATILQQYRHIDYLNDLQGTIGKLIDALGVRRLYKDDKKMDFIEFESAPLIRGTEHLEPLIRHIREENVIKIVYRSFVNGEAKEHILHPCLLKEYRNRWYLVAFHDHHREYRIFGLERIEQMDNILDREYIKRPFNVERFFRDTIGITTPDREPVEIVIAFSEQQARYIATQPVHNSQMLIKEEKGRIFFQFTLVPTYEFTEKVLGWGTEVEVISPEWYRKEMADRVSEMCKIYSEIP